MFKQIRWRLVGWNVLVLAVILMLVGGAVYLIARSQLTSQVDQNLQSRSAAFPPQQRGGGGGGERGGPPGPDFGPEGFSGGFFFVVLDDEGQIVSNPQQVALSLGPVTLDRPEYRTVTIDGDAARLYLMPRIERDGTTSTLIVGQSLATVEQALQRLLIGLLAGGSAGLLLSCLGAWFLAGRALIPIEFAFRRQQEFVADASHELRTPLTVLRASADLLDQHRSEPLEANGQLFDDFRSELLRLERLATDLLLLARADLGEIDLAVAPVDLEILATDVVRRTLPLAQSRGVTMRVEGHGQEVMAEIDPDRIQQVLLVLIDNALKHMPSGGQVTIGVQKQGHDAVLTVRDTGEGIPSEHLPRLFDRFYRVDRARSREQGSAGLGLPIAKSLVEAHGGQLTISSMEGSGTTATIRLPLAPAAPSLSGKLGRLTVRGSQGVEPS